MYHVHTTEVATSLLAGQSARCSVKGGPYSHGSFAGSGQFGQIEIEDDGGQTVSVRLSGHTWDGDELLSYEYEIEVPDGAIEP